MENVENHMVVEFSSPSSGDKLLAQANICADCPPYGFSSPSSGDKLLAWHCLQLLPGATDKFSSPSSGDKLLALIGKKF